MERASGVGFPSRCDSNANPVLNGKICGFLPSFFPTAATPKNASFDVGRLVRCSGFDLASGPVPRAIWAIARASNPIALDAKYDRTKRN